MGFCCGEPERKNQSKTESRIDMITEKAMDTMQQRPAMFEDMIRSIGGADFRGNQINCCRLCLAKVESRLLQIRVDT